MFFYLVQGVALALPATLMPGPFQAFLLSYALKNGWKRTLPAALAPLITDGPVIVLVLFVLAKTPEGFLNFLHIAGGVLILYFAWKMFKTLRQDTNRKESLPHAASKTLLGAVALNILNPSPYIFWSVIAGPILLEGWRHSKGMGVAFVSGFYTTFVLSLALFIIMFGTIGKMNPKLSRVLSTVSALALLLFGIYELWTGIAKTIILIKI